HARTGGCPTATVERTDRWVRHVPPPRPRLGRPPGHASVLRAAGQRRDAGLPGLGPHVGRVARLGRRQPGRAHGRGGRRDHAGHPEARRREAVVKAAVLRSGRMVVDEVPEPVFAEGQVLVQTRACGICGSDLHTVQHADQMAKLSKEQAPPATDGMSINVFDPARDVVMGHEFVAEVLEVGPGAFGQTPGATVVSMPIVADERGMHAVGYSNDYPGGYGERMALSA